MNKETLYQVVKDIYTSKVFIKSALDLRIMIFNKKLKLLFKKYDCVKERMENIEEIFSLIDSYLGDSLVERKKNGEVFTAFGLINEMLDKLPVEVWSNPDLRWLDPANGIGNFPAVIIQRLMVGLKDVIKDDKKRYDHIITKQIFVCDISSKNMFLYLNIFDPNMEYKDTMNYFRGSYLSKEFNELGWGEFDIIVGNPPYNDSEGIKGGGNNLYVPFIGKSLSTIKENGYLCFVTNAGWLKKTNLKKRTILDDVLELNLLHLNINECKKWFDVGGAMPFCYFLIKNNNKYEKTNVVSIDDNKNIYNSSINLNQLSWVPRIVSDEVYSIIRKFTNKKFEFERIDSVSEEHKNNRNIVGFKRLSHLVKPYCVKATNTLDKGTWIIIKSNNVNSDVAFFNSPIFSFLNFIHRYDAVIYHYMIDYFGYDGDISNKTDQEIYEYFHLNQDEIDLIEKTIK